MEIAGHEFWGPDGATIWYDLQTPRSQVFWLAGHVLATGETRRYPVARKHWSCTTTSRPTARASLATVEAPAAWRRPGMARESTSFTPVGGELRARCLVNLSDHDYRVEPNVAFLPGDTRPVFTSSLHGQPHVYAREVDPAGRSAAIDRDGDHRPGRAGLTGPPP